MKIKTFTLLLLAVLFLPGASELPHTLEFKSLAVGPDGTVWIGTNQYLYYKSPGGELQKHSGQVGSVTNTNSAVSGIAINTSVTPNEMLLATTKGAVLYTFNNSELLSGTTYTPGEQIKAVAMNNDTKWVATANGVYIMKNNQPVNINYKDARQEAAILSNPITDIKLSNDTAYICTNNDPEGYYVEVFTKEIDGFSGATGYQKWGPCELRQPLCVATSNSGEQWYGTESDGIHWHLNHSYSDGSAWLMLKGNDLLDNRVDAVALSSDGHAYAGTPKGISKVVKDGYMLKVVKNYSLENGKMGIIDIAVDAENKVYAISEKSLYVLSGDNLTPSDIISTDKAIKSSAISIYPNPATDYVNIRIENDQTVKVDISLLNINGAKVRQLFDGQIDEAQTLSFPLSGMTPGSYICSMNIGSNYYASVLVIR